MKVRVQFSTPDLAIDEIFQGDTAEIVVDKMKKTVGSRVGFAIRLIVNSFSALSFAQEIVRRYNNEFKKSVPIPTTCAEFIRLGVAEGIVTVIDP